MVKEIVDYLTNEDKRLLYYKMATLVQEEEGKFPTVYLHNDIFNTISQ